jgi:hypothetical protein
VWCGVVWCGVVWCGVVWCGVVWCGVVWCGVGVLVCWCAGWVPVGCTRIASCHGVAPLCITCHTERVVFGVVSLQITGTPQAIDFEGQDVDLHNLATLPEKVTKVSVMVLGQIQSNDTTVPLSGITDGTGCVTFPSFSFSDGSNR